MPRPAGAAAEGTSTGRRTFGGRAGPVAPGTPSATAPSISWGDHGSGRGTRRARADRAAPAGQRRGRAGRGGPLAGDPAAAPAGGPRGAGPAPEVLPRGAAVVRAPGRAGHGQPAHDRLQHLPAPARGPAHPRGHDRPGRGRAGGPARAALGPGRGGRRAAGARGDPLVRAPRGGRAAARLVRGLGERRAGPAAGPVRQRRGAPGPAGPRARGLLPRPGPCRERPGPGTPARERGAGLDRGRPRAGQPRPGPADLPRVLLRDGRRARRPALVGHRACTTVSEAARTGMPRQLVPGSSCSPFITSESASTEAASPTVVS